MSIYFACCSYILPSFLSCRNAVATKKPIKTNDELKLDKAKSRFISAQSDAAIDMNMLPPVIRIFVESLAEVSGVAASWYLMSCLHLTSVCSNGSFVMETHSHFRPLIFW